MSPREWDAATYDRTSLPQETWGREVVERLDLRGDERVLDAGCGTGRVTAFLVERLPRGEVVAVDGSEAMVAETRRRLGDRVEAFASDLLELELDRPVDAVLSTATFHWIADHDALFARLHGVLKPGGGSSRSAAAPGTSRTSSRRSRRSGTRRWPAGPARGTSPRPATPRSGSRGPGSRTSGRGCSPGPSSPRTRARSWPRRSSARTSTGCRRRTARTTSTP